MAERKPGPVRPPVIDLEAREASAVEPGAEGASRRPPRSRTARRGAKSGDGQDAARDVTPEPTAGTEPPDKPEEPGAMPPPPEAGMAAGAAAEPAATEAAASAPPAGTGDPAAPAATMAGPTLGSASETEEPPPAQPAPERGPEAAPAEPQPEPLPPPPPRPPARLAMPWSAISIAAIAGALLGAGLTYLAANWIALPSQAPPFEDPGPALATLSTNYMALDARLAALEQAVTAAQVDREAARADLDALGAALRQEIADVRAAIPEAQDPVDLEAIEQRLENLDSRVTAIAAGASSDDAAALAESMGSIEQTLDDLTARVGELSTHVATTDESLSTLRTGLDEARAAIAAQNRTLAGGTEVGPAVRLPLLVSGLESAFAGGRPYGSELESLRALLPDLDIPDSVLQNAADGLPRPDAIGPRFEDRLPAILAGRTAESTGDWTQDAIEWAKALLALRPAEEIEGSTPEAIVSRLEAAVERRDYAAAAVQLAQLPAPMREASGEVGADILALAEAEAFVTGLRAEILAPAEPAN